jgi:hypothetical protein
MAYRFIVQIVVTQSKFRGRVLPMNRTQAEARLRWCLKELPSELFAWEILKEGESK